MKTPKKRATPKKRGSGLPDIRPGTPVEVEGLCDPFGGQHFVTPTRHTVGDGGYAAPVRGRALEGDLNEFLALPPGKTWNPEAITRFSCRLVTFSYLMLTASRAFKWLLRPRSAVS